MIPGPGEIDDDIMSVMGRPIAAHYGPDFAKLYWETIGLMQRVFGTTADTLFLFSSGQGAVEAAIGSLFAPDEQVLIINNGFFGERLQLLAQALGLRAVPVTAEWGHAVSQPAIRETLTANPDIKGILAVHHETSTGMLNPVQDFGTTAREFDLPLVVDAVASVGGDPLCVDDWGIDICVTAGNKCLGAPVGLAALSVSDRAWAIMDQKPKTAAGWYLNLKTWRSATDEQRNWHPTPVTISSQTLEALHLALTKLCDEGLENRWRRYKETAEWFRSAMKQRGFTFFVKGEEASSVISVLNCPAKVDSAHFVTTLRDEHQIQISYGIGYLRNQIFRVGHLGNARENIKAFLAAVDAYLDTQG